MSSFRQRYQHRFRYLSNALEDILAVTLFLPFTICLFILNTFVDQLEELPHFPSNLSNQIWNVGRQVFLLPLRIVLGLFHLTFIPMLAFFLSLNATKPAALSPTKYEFKLGQLFQRWAGSTAFAVLFHFLIIPLSFMPYGELYSIIALILYFFGGVLTVIGGCMLTFDTLLRTLNIIPAILYLFAAALILTCSPIVLLCFSLISFFAIMEIHSHGIFNFTIRVIDNSLNFIQKCLFKIGVNPYHNHKDIMLQNDITRISHEQLLITNSNHALNLEELETIFTNMKGFYNPYILEAPTLIEKEDFFHLENHPKIQQYPGLMQYIATNKEAYLKKQNPTQLISENSLQTLEQFAVTLSLNQDDFTDFPERICHAKAKLDEHLDSVSPFEKRAVLELNIINGEDPTYQLKHVLGKVLDFTPNQNEQYCKKGVSKLILQTIAKVRDSGNQESDEANNIFWKNTIPTHGMI